MTKNKKISNVIKVNFRNRKLSIDNDSYLSRVTKIHCRVCLKQRDRIGAMELVVTWGYVCTTCQDKIRASKGYKSASISDDEINISYSKK